MSTGEPPLKRARDIKSLIQQVHNGSAYSEVQRLLTKVAPTPDLNFCDLRANQTIVFRDITKSLLVLDAVAEDPQPAPCKAARAFLRGRRWGKSVLGDMWLEFLRGREDLFRGTWAHDHMRPDRFVGVKLDISQCSTYGTFVELLVQQINKALRLAEQVEDFAKAAKGKQVAIRPADRPPGIVADWSARHCTAIIANLLFQLEEISDLGRKVALFVDEYDSMVIEALRPGSSLDYSEVLDFFAQFYKSLKAKSATVPFLFITGSSRLAIQGFWSGANSVSDISLDETAATLLGYTWEEIETLYQEHLQLLEAKFSQGRVALKAQIEEWYNKHRWTPESTAEVFNPHSIQQFMLHGKFKPYWAETGESSFVTGSQHFLASVVRAAAGRKVAVAYGDLTQPVLPEKSLEGKYEFTADAQCCLLAGAGVLAVDCEYTAPATWNHDQRVDLQVPNRDAKTMLLKVLQRTKTSPSTFTKDFMLDYLHKHDLAGLFASLAVLETLQRGLHFFSGVDVLPGVLDDEDDLQARVSEFRLSLAFSANVFLTGLQGYRAEEPCPRIDAEQLAEQAADVLDRLVAPRALKAQDPLRGQQPRAHHVFDLGHVVHVAEFKVRRKRKICALLSQALLQCLKYQLVKVQEGAERRFSAHVFGDEGDQAGVLLAGTKSLNLTDAHRLIAQLSCGESKSTDLILADGVMLD